MNNLIHKFKQSAKHIRMSVAEKSRVRNFVISFINNKQSIPSPYSFIQFFSKGRVAAAAIIFALVIASAGTSYAADQSLPGETLYPIKINVNEALQSFVTFGTGAKVALALDRAKERLEEAEELSVQGKLNPETQAIILSNFTSQTDEIKAQAAVLVSTDNQSAANTVSNELQATVQAHAQILKAVATQSPNQVAIVNSFVKQVETQVGASSSTIAILSASSSVNTIMSSLNKMAEASTTITNTKNYIAEANLPDEVAVKVNLSIGRADQLFAEGSDIIASSTASSTAASSSSNQKKTKPSKAAIKAWKNKEDAIDIEATTYFSQAEAKANEAKALTDLYLNGGVNAEQVINSIPDATLNPDPQPEISASSTATTTVLIATSTASSTSSDASSSLDTVDDATSSIVSTSTIAATSSELLTLLIK